MMCGCVDVRIYGCADMWMCGYVDVWMYGCADVWMCGSRLGSGQVVRMSLDEISCSTLIFNLLSLIFFTPHNPRHLQFLPRQCPNIWDLELHRRFFDNNNAFF